MDFKQDVKAEQALMAPSQLIDIAEASEIIFEKDREAEVIEGEKGDNLWVIAQRYDLIV
ncbi:hypothetical protein MFMK1_002109 [Metallumcola ferriviriculae]|uniref:Uncharacterized protein n=1 Tax=Metallumcola ferriviriculae TaxID=3039180 RepID=A0AAU0UNB6_9FIRM|nr:hypothetical protein MFMK1_002109 [Desulfitibacteraceae bacterium MK1]